MENHKNRNNSDIATLNKIHTAKASLEHATKAAAKAGAGNIPGAVLEVISDENTRNVIFGIIGVFVFVVMAISMLIGTAITGTVESIYSGYMENWEESWEEQGVLSNGSSLYLYGQGVEQAQQKALLDSIYDLLFPETDPADNSVLGNSSSLTDVDNSDYRTDLNAITSLEALTGENGSLRKRLEMIKGRVAQRGIQFETYANTQYLWDAAGKALATILAESYENPYLFAGVALENCKIDINREVFELTDLQALKILAAYSIQKDCLLGSIDMWDLMDYCGWYSTEFAELEVDQNNSIYDISLTKVFGNEIEGVIAEGQLFPTEVEYLTAPSLPVWSGSCAAQWYYEEIAQLTAHNAKYDRLLEYGGEEVVADMVRYDTTDDGQIDTSNFEKLSQAETFGIIDRLFSSANATISIFRSDYTGIDAVPREFINSLDGILKSMWDEARDTDTKWTSGGNLVSRTADNYHSITVYTTSNHSYYMINMNSGYQFPTQRGSDVGYVVFGDLIAGNTYEVYEKWYERTAILIPVEQDDGSVVFVEEYQYTLHTEKIDRFTAFSAAEQATAYQLYFQVDIDYAARSVDDLIIDLLGLWPGSLADTETGTDGRQYASSYIDNEKLALTWTDTYTDSDGNAYELEFTRQQAYQTAAYEDIVLAIADLLSIETTGLFEPTIGYGESLVDMALKEYEYYQANNLSGGMRYWGIFGEALGWTFNYDVPWCACFVLTTAWQAGLIGEDKPWGDMGAPAWPTYCRYLYDELIASGGTGHTSRTENYIPVPGDIIFFGEYAGDPNPAHVGIVVEVLENGNLVTIEGNSGNKVKQNTYSNYALGTYLYTRSDGISICISAYATPVYPSSFLEKPLYQQLYSTVTPSIAANLYGSTASKTLLAGITRFRWSQLDSVLTELKKTYPTLYREAMRTSYTEGSVTAFIDSWNVVANTYGDDFRAAQQTIATRLFYRPLTVSVQSRTGFDWTATDVREEIFLALASTSDQLEILEDILSLICTGMDKSISDSDLLNTLYEEGTLHTLVTGNQSALWPTDAPDLREKWISSIDAVIETLYANLQNTESLNELKRA